MKRWMIGLASGLAGCATTTPPELPSVAALPGPLKTEPAKSASAYAQTETYAIDLPTVLKLVDGNNPRIGNAAARLREADARVQKADVLWLPTLGAGAIYNRFDGQTQNQRGEVFGTSRANLFGGGALAVGFDFAEAYYRPLVERQLRASADFQYQSQVLGSELDAVLAYLDLVQVKAQQAINADILAKAEDMLQAAKNATAARLDRSAGDLQRAKTEVYFRQQEKLDLEGRAAAASARKPNRERDVALIDESASLDQLIGIGVMNNPALAANRAAIGAAWERVKAAKQSPWVPKLLITDQIGSFGGGLNDDLSKFDARNALGAQLFWEIRNLGLGNRAEVAERRAQMEQTQYELLDTQARLAAEIVEASQLAIAKAESLKVAELAVKESTDLYRIAKDGTFNVIDAKNLFDALRPLQAIQTLSQAKNNYLSAVMDYNRAQYRLFTALGQPPKAADGAKPQSSTKIR